MFGFISRYRNDYLGTTGFDCNTRVLPRAFLQITAKVINLFGAPALEVAA